MKKDKSMAYAAIQVKYSYSRAIFVQLAVGLLTAVWFLINLCKVNPSDNPLPSFTILLWGLPMEIFFIAQVVGTLLMLGIGFVKQEKDERTFNRCTNSRFETIVIKWIYSILMCLQAVMIHVLVIGLMYIMFQIKFPETIYGIKSIEFVFYKFYYLRHIWPTGGGVDVLFPVILLLISSAVSLEFWQCQKRGSIGMGLLALFSVFVLVMACI